VSEVHFLVPAGYTDPRRPSGGNLYDARLVAGLQESGWTVVVHEVPGGWPTAGAAVGSAVATELAALDSGSLVVVDGLLATAAAIALLHEAERLHEVALVHMPGPPGGPPAAVLHAARVIVVTSQWTGRMLREQHGLSAADVVVAPPGAQLAPLSQGTADENALVCVASVTPTKGHDVLFTALSMLAGRAWTCTCVGAVDIAPDFVAAQRSLLADNGIGERVTFTGPLRGAELERAYDHADVLVLASRQEGYGMVVTEALAHGLPVVATAVGGVEEALGRTADGRVAGLLVPRDDPAALADAISRWLDDSRLRADLRSLSRLRRAMLVGWEQPITTVSAALRRLTAG
jgi:glycosyltransferase involved in cell wall biosynthesis